METGSADPVLPSLRKMAIQSADTLRGHEIDQVIADGWRDAPPLLIGPRGKPESEILLKGVIRKGIPPALRCAVWLSNIIQAVHPQEEPEYWHEYRTLEKVRSLDFAYENLLKPLVNDEMEKRPGESVFEVTNEVWKHRSIPTYGQSSDAPRVEGMIEHGEQALKRVLIALEHVIGVECAPLLPTLAALLLTCMSESYAFTAIREMAHGASWYFATSRREHIAHCRCFGIIIRKLHPHTAEYLEDRGVLDDDSLEKIFRDMFVGVLPIHLVQRIMDVYTLEGFKVLYRVGISLFVLYKIEAAQNLVTISNADDWWSTLRTWASHRLFNFNVVMRKAYGVHGKMLRTQLRFPGRPLLARIVRVEEQRLGEDYEDEGRGHDASPLGLVESHETIGTSGQVEEVVKRVLVKDMRARQLLANWLPITMRLTDLDLLYSTNYHGRTLERFYTRLKRAKNTILVAEAFSDKDPPGTEPAIIGMYAPQAWHPSNQVYGDGSCFLFRISPNPKCWKWTPTLEEATNMDDLGEFAVLNQFMVSRNAFISMGGNRDGSSGFRINEDLTIGESSPAAGFDNEPLHGVGEGSVFQLGLVEVYGLVRQIDGRPV
mmetsp:Transcript_3551/g.7125  ORF Transcript_3551/g.7125 Transcript_3551/m.7125 type:complete len:601 (+) Transcript_3551:100-1902(+)